MIIRRDVVTKYILNNTENVDKSDFDVPKGKLIEIYTLDEDKQMSIISACKSFAKDKGIGLVVKYWGDRTCDVRLDESLSEAETLDFNNPASIHHY